MIRINKKNLYQRGFRFLYEETKINNGFGFLVAYYNNGIVFLCIIFMQIKRCFELMPNSSMSKVAHINTIPIALQGLLLLLLYFDELALFFCS